MIIGSLGDIVFEVSEKTIRTIRDAAWSGSARLAEHPRHMKKALVEFCGTDPDTFSFSLRLSAYLGADPQTDIDRLTAYKENGTAVQLIVGMKRYGSYRWLIEKHKIVLEHFGKGGSLATVDVLVTLKEYAKE